MKKLLFIVLVLCVAAAPAFASVQNMKVSGSISSKFVNRYHLDLGLDSDHDWQQNYFLSLVKVRFDADLTDNVAATVELINEREWGNESTDNQEVDINQAYVTLREMLYSPLTVVIGRQYFTYGSQLLMSSAPGANTGLTSSYASDFSKQKAFDAIRAILDYDPLTIEVFYAKLENDNQGDNEFRYDDQDLYGIDAVYEFGDDMDTQVEAYYFARTDRRNNTVSDSLNGDSVYIPGVRVSLNPLEDLLVSAEYAHQFGNDYITTATSRERNANAIQLTANYDVPLLEDYDPVLNYRFTYVSGDLDKGSTDANDHRGWIEFYEGMGGNQIWDNLFAIQNLFIHEVSLTVNPIEDVTSTLTLTGLWLDDEYDVNDSSYTLGGETVAINEDEDYAGSEVDIKTVYDYTEDVSIMAELGWFFPGDLFDGNTDSTASQAIVGVDVAF